MINAKMGHTQSIMLSYIAAWNHFVTSDALISFFRSNIDMILTKHDIDIDTV